MSFVNRFSNSVCFLFVLLTVSFALQRILNLIRSHLFIFAFISVGLGVQLSSVAQSCLTLCDPMDCSMPGLPVHHQLLEITKSCPLSQWCHATILSFVILFSSHHQPFPGSGSFQMSQFFASGGQSIGASALASFLPMNTQDWSPLGWTGWISFQSKGLSRVFSNTTVQKHQFFVPQLSSQSNSHSNTWLLEKP